MIILKIKDIEGLKAKSKEKDNKLVVCSLCPSWNFTKEEIEGLGKELNADIVKVPIICNRPKINIDAEGTIFVLACGAGAQVVSESLNKDVVPAADTMGIGVKDKDGGISKYCIACGDCVIEETADICPKARCEKSLLNGPCAGVHDGLCELSTKENPIKCGWNEITKKMIARNEADKLIKIRMPK